MGIDDVMAGIVGRRDWANGGRRVRFTGDSVRVMSQQIELMAATSPGDNVTVALYSGLYVVNDAISASARYKLEILLRLRAAGIPVEPVVFTHGTNQPGAHVRAVPTTAELIRLPEFQRARIHIYEFGIYYELFNSIFLLPDSTHRIAVYHNITPARLVNSQEALTAIERSLVQKHNLFLADRIACDSEYNRRDLLEFGIAPERLSVLHIPATLPLPSPEQRQQLRRYGVGGRRVRFLCVGRLVRSKGPGDLLCAVADLLRSGFPNVEVRFVGNQSLSDVEVIADLQSLVLQHNLGSVVSFVGELDDAALAVEYSRADAVVVPSYHEGFCVPVVEALAAGCYVVGYDTSTLPFVSGGLGTLVPMGDVLGLADALREFVVRRTKAWRDGSPMRLRTTAGELTEEAWRERVQRHLEDFSFTLYERTFLKLVGDLLPAEVRTMRTDVPASGR